MAAFEAGSSRQAVKLAATPGSTAMPSWQVGELVPAPVFTGRNWFALLGPGLLMAGAAVGGGEWLLGPVVTAKYGAGLLWLATLSILAQVVYNIEISRYTLYTGEPIFTGKFRLMPGPHVWLMVYLVLDFGSVFPYLAANSATPLVAMWLGRVPDPDSVSEQGILRAVGIGVFLVSLVPLVFGGRIYNTLKNIMTIKIVLVFGFLLILGACFSTPATWWAIISGFGKIGTVPIKVESVEAASAEGKLLNAEVTQTAEDAAITASPTDNVFVSLWQGRGFPSIDFTMIATLAAFASIAGSGGLTNVAISNYTRDSGWGMGYHIGAIPSIVGAQKLELSHVGMVFQVTPESIVRWRGWVRHVVRDQVAVWMPACFVGVALPAMLSVQFLPRGTTANDWTAAALTAAGVSSAVGSAWGPTLGLAAWYATLFCGFLVLGPTVAQTADGIIRRWVDVFWTASPRMQKLPPNTIRYVFFAAVVAYGIFGVISLSLGKPMTLLKIATNIMNFALGFSCFHTLVVNLWLLPRELRPNWFMRVGMVLAGSYFTILATLSLLQTLFGG
jgi:hypothetical protein